ncbi:oxidoreductase [Ancrocorticia populi]|uniref:oxidoreductase n=1 Tax=Ancrocorticia populi TaxID=2175228 RepID=UPI0023522DF0|nr:oxidoreductase [Ancrocorticia populi]
MGLFSRRKTDSGKGSDAPRRDQKAARTATIDHFRDFVATRTGVEGYFEPETPREQSALLLVARDGEWTRRRVPDLKAAVDLTGKLEIPLYEIVKTGYPDSMRQWNEQQRKRS